MVWHKNNRVKDMRWYRRKESSFQGLEPKNIDLAPPHFLSKYICLQGPVTLLTLSQKVQKLNSWKDNFGGMLCL